MIADLLLIDRRLLTIKPLCFAADQVFTSNGTNSGQPLRL